MDYRWRKTKENKGKGIEIVSKEMAQFELVGIQTKFKDTKNSKEGLFLSVYGGPYKYKII